MGDLNRKFLVVQTYLMQYATMVRKFIQQIVAIANMDIEEKKLDLHKFNSFKLMNY